MGKSFVAVCTVDDVKEFSTIVAEVGEESILLTKIGENVYAFENRCSHEEVAFGEREIINGEIQCPMHGARFDVKTGKPRQIPAVVDIKTYDVKIANNDVLVAV